MLDIYHMQQLTGHHDGLRPVLALICLPSGCIITPMAEKTKSLCFNLVCAVSLVFGFTALWATAIHAAERPNIILMMADDLGWGDTGYNGNTIIKTPHLDRMSREGLRFNRFYAASSVCSPTRGACFTGRNPYRYGVYTANNYAAIDPYFMSLAFEPCPFLCR